MYQENLKNIRPTRVCRALRTSIEKLSRFVSGSFLSFCV
jgi:hypothetical protein